MSGRPCQLAPTGLISEMGLRFGDGHAEIVHYVWLAGVNALFIQKGITVEIGPARLVQ